MIFQTHNYGAFVSNDEGKCKLVLIHDMNAYRESKNIAALILNLHSKSSCVVLTSRSSCCIPGKNSYVHSVVGWVGLRDGVAILEKIKNLLAQPGFELVSSSP
jgi:hypothetical protein